MSDPAETLTVAVVPFDAVDREETVALINRAFGRYADRREPRTSVAGLTEEAGETAAFVQVRRRGQLVATAMTRPAEGTMPARKHGPALSDALYFGLAAVEPRAMNSGLGRRLLGESERLAQEHGYERVVLGTVRESGLVEYYARAGYIAYHQEEFPAGHWGITAPHRYYEMVKAL